VGFLFGETAGQKIGAVVELLDGSFDTFAELFADVGLLVDDRGDGKDRDARFVGDIVDARSLTAAQDTFFALLGHGMTESLP
jgi:hypothetical protein